MKLSRRGFLFASCSLAGCQPQAPQTPLAHLYGEGWVRGAYTHYAEAYSKVEGESRQQGFSAYRNLSQRGVSSLTQLQSREVPFFIRVSDDRSRFRVERDVPERLTFTRDMSQSEREQRTLAWERARDSIQRDYDDVQRLNASLTSLLSSVNAVRLVLDEGTLEQYRLCRTLGSLEQGGELPFALPYQVSAKDYQQILLLLLDRLEDDGTRLRQLEASMVATGLVARAADYGSISLAVNLQKVLLGVAADASSVADASLVYPGADDVQRSVASAKALRARIEQSPSYRAWLAAERQREDVLGQFLTVMESLSGIPVSSVYRQILQLWSGDGDYLGFLRMAAAFVPGGGRLSVTLQDALQRTEDVRRGLDGARALAATAQDGELAGGLVNVATASARGRVERQLVFYENREEVSAVQDALAQTTLLR